MQQQQTINEKREATSVVLLCFLLLMVFQPLLPLIADTIAHTWFSVAHAKQHAYGVEHLTHDLQAAQDNESKSVTISLHLDYALPITASDTDLKETHLYIKVYGPTSSAHISEMHPLPQTQPPDFMYAS